MSLILVPGNYRILIISYEEAKKQSRCLIRVYTLGNLTKLTDENLLKQEPQMHASIAVPLYQ